MIIPPAAPGTRADEGGGPSQGFLYGCLFYLKWRLALNQEISDSAAQQGWCPRSAACNSWCIHHPAVCDGRMCSAGTGAGRADGPIWLKNSPKQGLRGLAALSSWCIHPRPLPPCCYLRGRWGTTDDFSTISFCLLLFSASLVALANCIHVHSSILSPHLL